MGSKYWTPFRIALVASAISLSGAAPSSAPADKLTTWYEALGVPRPETSFGEYLARAARAQHGVKYEDVSPPLSAETLEVELDSFECVSLIESSLAVARCGWSGEPTTACFLRELEATRYRRGRMVDYASRLHYFVDWIDDNETRGRLENLTASFGGEPTHREFFHISARVLERSTLGKAQRAAMTQTMKATEKRLSAKTYPVLSREAAPPILSELEDGDLVAFVRERAGLLVHHAGFVVWANGTPRLLHASSYHGRVVITVRDVSNYLLRRPERRGVIIARPLPPPKP